MSVTDQVGREIRVGSTCKVMWNDAGASEGVVGATGIVTKVARTRVHLRIEGWAKDWVIGGRALSMIEDPIENIPTTKKDNNIMPKYSVYRLRPDRRFITGTDDYEKAKEEARSRRTPQGEDGFEVWDNEQSRPVFSVCRGREQEAS